MQLINFTESVFKKMGHSEKDATMAAKVLISADIRGIDSHGIARLSGYVRLWEANRVNSRPNVKIVYQTPSTAVVDGDAALGLIAGPSAMKIAIKKAKNVGTGWVAVKNSNHYGIAGYHSMMALEEDMIGISMTNASPLVAPTFSTDRMLGTNPISIAIPTKTQPPFVADMATTTIANGKLEVLQRKSEDAPLGWVQDKDGNPTTDCESVKKGGALLPLGGDKEHGSHKGYILSSIVDIFSAILSGANYGPWVPPFVNFLQTSERSVGEGIGHFFGAMRVDAFRPKKDFFNHIDNWISTFRNCKPIAGQEKVLIPGDLERTMEKEKMTHGISLSLSVIKDMNSLAEKFNLEF